MNSGLETTPELAFIIGAVVTKLKVGLRKYIPFAPKEGQYSVKQATQILSVRRNRKISIRLGADSRIGQPSQGDKKCQNESCLDSENKMTLTATPVISEAFRQMGQ